MFLTGADIASGPVWMEYIAFLRSLPVRDTLLQQTILKHICTHVQANFIEVLLVM